MCSVHTIGCGGREFGSFVSLLKAHEISCIVDVRRFSKSVVSEYNRENLERELPEFGIGYLFMGDTLGGFRQGGYRKHMEADAFKEGIGRLLERVKAKNIVLMCKERSDSGCHRRFIAEALKNVGISTIAIS